MLPVPIRRVIAEYADIYVLDMELIRLCGMDTTEWHCEHGLIDNPRAGHWLKRKFKSGYTRMFPRVAANPGAIELILENLDLANAAFISKNPHPLIEDVLKAHPELISWSNLCENPAPWAIAMLTANPEKIDWRQFCRNRGPDALLIWYEHLDKLNENYSCGNPIAAPFIMEFYTGGRFARGPCSNPDSTVFRKMREIYGAYDVQTACETGDPDIYASTILQKKDLRPCNDILIRHPLICQYIKSGQLWAGPKTVSWANPGVLLPSDLLDVWP